MDLADPSTASLPVLILFNQPSPHTRPEDRAAERGVIDAVAAVGNALARAGRSVETLGLADDFLPLVQRLRESTAVVFNFCEGFRGKAEGEAHVAALLELLEAPYTGNTPQAIALCLDKIRTKRLLRESGLPTPAFLELRSDHLALSDRELERELSARQLGWPVVVKPAGQDASQGLDQSSVARDLGQMRLAVDRVVRGYGLPVLVEQYVPGREFNVAVIGDPPTRALPVAEIVFEHTGRDRWPIVTYEAKWVPGSEEDRATVPRCPADLDDPTARELARLAVTAVLLTGCRDYARVDMRVNPEGQPFILEVNANPDLSPSSGLDRQLAVAGVSFDEFILQLVDATARRGRGSSPSEQRQSGPVEPLGAVATPAHPLSDSRLVLRPLQPSDREAIGDLLYHCGNFRPEEMEVARQLLDEALADQAAEEYQCVIATLEGRVVGYTCFGPVPVTEGVWDLYWIAVDPTVQRIGLGAHLQAATEQQIKSRGGRLMLAETSSLPGYAAARSFYLNQGYQLLDRLPDFYRIGDDRLTFGRRL